MVLLLLLAAQAAEPLTNGAVRHEGATYGPAAPRPVRKASAPVTDPCLNQKAEPGVILVCGKREDFRIDPDVLRAKRLVHNQTAPRPRENFKDNSCSLVGQMGCFNPPMIDLASLALSAASAVKGALQGRNVGKMLLTSHELSEYELYVESKRAREEAETGTAATAVPER